MEKLERSERKLQDPTKGYIKFNFIHLLSQRAWSQLIQFRRKLFNSMSLFSIFPTHVRSKTTARTQGQEREKEGSNSRKMYANYTIFLFLLSSMTVELFQILKDDAVKVLHSICQQIWKTQQWPQDWKSQFSFQSQRRAMPKNVQTTAQLHSSHMLAK